MARLVSRRALASSPFGFLAAALRKALLGGGHPDRLVVDEGGNLQELLCGIVHGTAPLGKARLLGRHSEKGIRAGNARPSRRLRIRL